jgi:hypothetical protein
MDGYEDAMTYMKNPATLPTTSMRAAQAVPEGCSEVGNMSIIKARSTAITACKNKNE